MSTSTNKSGGIGFFGLLAILFIGLKLTGHINWSWWVVLMPLYGPITLAIVIIVIVALIETIADDR